jgi:hypothetical protein
MILWTKLTAFDRIHYRSLPGAFLLAGGSSLWLLCNGHWEKVNSPLLQDGLQSQRRFEK